MESEVEYKTCPNCGNPECLKDDEFCFNCGVSLIDHCRNTDCEEYEIPIPDFVCFCPKCGEETYFMAESFIQPRQFDQSH